MLFFERKVAFKNGEEKVWILFYWTWRDFGLLPTYPFKGSKFHVVLFQKILWVGSILVLKIVLKKGWEALKAWDLKEGEVDHLLNKKVKVGI